MTGGWGLKSSRGARAALPDLPTLAIAHALTVLLAGKPVLIAPTSPVHKQLALLLAEGEVPHALEGLARAGTVRQDAQVCIGSTH